jgi:hypothetical protein
MVIKKINLNSLLLIVIFNFNTVALPHGVMWSNILSLFMILWLLFKGKITYVIIPLLLLFLYSIVQYITLEPTNTSGYYLRLFYYYTSVMAGVFFYIYFNGYYSRKEEVEKKIFLIVKINLFLFFIACIIFFTPLKNSMWTISNNINSYGELRLKLLFYEPAQFSFVFVFFLNYLLHKTVFYYNKSYMILTILTSIAIIIGKSVGTIGALLIAMLFSSVIFLVPLLKRFYMKIMIILIMITILFISFGDSFNRVSKILEGKDGSGNVRVVYATSAAYNMINKYNYYFGVGFGETKKYVNQFTSQFQGYGTDRLPNSFASTLATVGIIGILLKFIFLLFFFIKTRVYDNIFRLTLFFYILVYGFTGGWMLNVYEFILWAFAFSPVFSEFDRKKIFQ